MLKQNLEDKCFTMANIFSFAEKVIPDFKNKSEGDKFLFLYCITAKLLSNRLYDNESKEDKINCLLNRIPKENTEDVEQLKKSLGTFVGENDFSVDKVKSFFDTNKNLLTSIYGNDKPSDLLLFFAQMQSKNIFKKKNNEAFVNGIENNKVKKGGLSLAQYSENHSNWSRNKDRHYYLNAHLVNFDEISVAISRDPNRIFNNYVDDFNKNMKLEIFSAQENEYKTKSFKLTERCSNNYGRLEIVEKAVNCGHTLDIDKILKEKFDFKKIDEMSEDKLNKLNLSYDEEFIYFLASKDFSNEYIFQESYPFSTFTMPKNIKPETTLKIYDYFVKLNHRELINISINYLKDKFETSKSLFDAYEKLKDSLNFEQDKLPEIFIGNPPKVKQILKCKDTKSPEEINELLGRCTFQNVIGYFVDTDDNRNQDLLSKYMLQNPEKLCNDLKYIHDGLDYLNEHTNQHNDDNKLKKLQNLMKSFFALENADELLNECDSLNVINYFLDHDEGKERLLKNIYNNVKELEGCFEDKHKTWKKLKNNENKTEQDNAKLKKLEYLITKFLLDCKEEVFANNQKYIDDIIYMFNLQEEFCIYDLNYKKEIDVTGKLKNLLNELIDKSLGLVEKGNIQNKNDLGMPEKDDEKDKGKNDQVIVEINGKSYDLTKIYSCPCENTLYEQYPEKNKYSIDDPVEDLQKKIGFHKKILESKVVSQEKKQTIYLLAKKYKEKLQSTYNDFEKLVEDRFNDSINRSCNNFLNSLGIDQKTYDRLKNKDKDKMTNRKTYLEKKANVTNFDHFKENWMTWLSFILTFGITAFIYNFIWKPEYQNEMNQLETDLINKQKITSFQNIKTQFQDNFNNGISELKLDIPDDNFNDENDKFEIDINIVAYKFSEAGEIHQKMIGEMDKFLEAHEKEFEPEKQKSDNIILEQKPKMNEICTGENTNPNKISEELS